MSHPLQIREKWYSISEDIPQSEWDKMAELMMVTLTEDWTPSLPSHESVVRRSAQKARAVENCRSTILPIWKRLQLFFAQLFL